MHTKNGCMSPAQRMTVSYLTPHFLQLCLCVYIGTLPILLELYGNSMGVSGLWLHTLVLYDVIRYGWPG